MLGRSPNGDALSRSRRSLARHVAASVRDASVSASLTQRVAVTHNEATGHVHVQRGGAAEAAAALPCGYVS